MEGPTPDEPHRVAVSGDLDYAGSDGLEDVLTRLAGPGVDLVVDLGGLVYCDSSGLRVLLAGAQRCEERGGRLVLAGVTGQPLRALRLTGLDTVLGR